MTKDKKTIDDGEAMSEIRKILEKREKTIQEQEEIKTQQKEQDQNKEITKKDLQDLIGLMQNQPAQTIQPDLSIPQQNIQQQQQQQQPPSTKQQIAAVAMKDAKNISVLSLMILILPIITIFITMMKQEMIAIIITLAISVYPILLFVRSIGTQTYLSEKYGFRPLFKFRSQQTRQLHTNMNPQEIQKQKNQETIL